MQSIIIDISSTVGVTHELIPRGNPGRYDFVLALVAVELDTGGSTSATVSVDLEVLNGVDDGSRIDGGLSPADMSVSLATEDPDKGGNLRKFSIILGPLRNVTLTYASSSANPVKACIVWEAVN